MLIEKKLLFWTNASVIPLQIGLLFDFLIMIRSFNIIHYWAFQKTFH